jgi:hypothetical protein
MSHPNPMSDQPSVTPRTDAMRQIPRLFEYFEYVRHDAPRNSIDPYAHEGGLPHQDLRDIRDHAKKLEQENAALRELAEGLAKHGAEFMRLHLAQGILMADFSAGVWQNSAEADEMAKRITEMSCQLQDAEDAFTKLAARYRAACPGEGKASSASNSQTASREIQG